MNNKCILCKVVFANIQNNDNLRVSYLIILGVCCVTVCVTSPVDPDRLQVCVCIARHHQPLPATAYEGGRTIRHPAARQKRTGTGN